MGAALPIHAQQSEPPQSPPRPENPSPASDNKSPVPVAAPPGEVGPVPTNGPLSVPDDPHSVPNDPHSVPNDPHSVPNDPHSVPNDSHSVPDDPYSVPDDPPVVSAPKPDTPVTAPESVSPPLAATPVVPPTGHVEPFAGAAPLHEATPTDATPAHDAVPSAGNLASSGVDPLDLARDAFAIPSPGASVEPAPGTVQFHRFANVWQRIKAGFTLPALDDALVHKWEHFYAARPEYWERINERSKRYLYFITREIERRGMPLEIALLPVIESAYNPEALSRARALGIWQFIPATGKLYGLAQNWWMDNRRDVGVATASALDYLEKLHDMFGDWQLALAAYNWGEGAVQRAVNRNRARSLPVDYSSLRMPPETRNYLPKLQAIKNIVMAPEKFGLSLPDVPDSSYFVTVTTDRHIDLALAAKLADVSLEDFKMLNPAYNRPVIASDGEQRINLPSNKAETFVMNLDSYHQPLVSWRPYRVKSGEGLDKIAPQFGIGVDELRRVNGLTGRKRIVPGFTLLVPAKSGAAPDVIPVGSPGTELEFAL